MAKPPRPSLPLAPGPRRSPPSLEVGALPRAVQLLRGRLLETARSRDIDDLRVPLGWNEVPPLFTRGQKAGFDPIEYLKNRSFDRQGREMLDILQAVLTSAYLRETRGPSVSYVWPVFPARNRASGSAQFLAPWRCVRFADLTATAPGGGPLIHRIAIGQDGTWHYFWTEAEA